MMIVIFRGTHTHIYIYIIYIKYNIVDIVNILMIYAFYIPSEYYAKYSHLFIYLFMHMTLGMSSYLDLNLTELIDKHI